MLLIGAVDVTNAIQENADKKTDKQAVVGAQEKALNAAKKAKQSW